MTDGFTQNPAMVAHITCCLFLSRLASTKQRKNLRERLEARIVLLVLAVVSALMLRSEGAAQTFTTLHNFTGTNDGAMPLAGLLLSSNTLYGTTWGETWCGTAFGTVFAVNTDGSGFRVVHNFSVAADGSQGIQPSGSLIISGNTLYGTASHGGIGGALGGGTVFMVNIDGTGFKVLHNFTGDDGALPAAALLLTNNTLYGTTWQSTYNGTVFSMNTDGTGFFQIAQYLESNVGSTLVLSGDTLYGTAYGVPDLAGFVPGNVFAVNTDGTALRDLHDFTAFSDQGAGPYGGVVLSGNTLYGTTKEGGTNNLGTVFKVNTDGTGFTVLHSFTGPDGSSPAAALLLSGNTLYGTGWTVFQLNTDGTGFTVLHSFSAYSTDGLNSCGCCNTNFHGAVPESALIISGNTLYGTAQNGGSSGFGTVFSISLPAKPAISMVGHQLVLAWPTNVTGSLQSTTNLASPVWTSNLPAPVVVNGQYTVTNPVSGTQQFFRLSQ